MSYLALLTDRFDDMVRFYGGRLAFPTLDRWDRPNARGHRFDLGGLQLELIDNTQERTPFSLGPPSERAHIVIEVDDVQAVRARLPIPTPQPAHTSWGACLFQIRDPDGVAVTFLQWDKPRCPPT